MRSLESLVKLPGRSRAVVECERDSGGKEEGSAVSRRFTTAQVSLRVVQRVPRSSMDTYKHSRGLSLC